MKQIKISKIWLYILGGLFVTAPVITFAATSTWGIADNFPDAFKQIFQFIVGLATVIFVILLLVGGIQYLAAAGNEEASKKAKALIMDALIGLIIVGIAFAAGNWIITKMGFTEAGRSYITTGGVDAPATQTPSGGPGADKNSTKDDTKKDNQTPGSADKVPDPKIEA